MLWSRPSAPLRGRQPAELAAEENQRLVEQPRCSRSASSAAVGWSVGGGVADQPLVQVGVMVPARLGDLDETHARLAQPPGHQALAGEAAGRAGLHAVGVEHRLRLPGDVEQLRHLALHPERQLVGLDHALELVRSAGPRRQVAVHRLDQVDLLALQRRGRLRLEVRHRSRGR